MATYRFTVGLSWDGDGGPGVNVWHIRGAGGIGTSQQAVQPMVDAVHQFYNTLAGAVSGTANFYWPNMVITADGAVDVDTQEFVPIDWTEITTSGNTGKTSQLLQVCVSWRTAIRARRGMGRTFLGPLSNEMMDADGSPNSDLLTQVGSAAQTLVDASTTTDNGAVGVYGLQSPAPEGTTDYSDLPHVIRDIIGYKIQDRFAYLSSRRD